MDNLLHTPEGVRDIYNIECEKKLSLEERLHKILKLYGYHDIQTPMFEYFDVFRKEIGTISSKELYKEFERLELPRLTGKNCELVLTKTYMKTQINSKQFLTDFKPDSKMYQKYVEQKPVKGHLSLKRLNG